MVDDPNKPKQELTFFDQIAGDLGEVSAEDKAALAEFKQGGMKEEAKGLPLIAPRIDILHQGAAAFKFREEPEETNLKKSFQGILLHVDPQRAWWETSLGADKGEKGAGGAGQVPDCYSRDLVVPDPTCAKPQATRCDQCKWNQFESDRKGGRGKDCKEVRRLFIMPEGKLDPHVLNVPPTSLKGLKKYFTFLAENKIPRPQFALTKFSLRSVENREDITYSELVLTFVKPLDERVVVMALQSKKALEEMLRNTQPITRDEFHPAEPGSQG